MEFVGAIIGGTGVGGLLWEMAEGGQTIELSTRSGLFRARTLNLAERSILVVPRHGGGHSVPPHKVPYAAMALGLAELKVPVCFATAASGSLHTDWLPGTFAVCTDTIDVSARRLTLFQDEVVHTDFSNPFPASSRLLEAAVSLGIAVKPSAVYINVDGPRFESPAEIRAFQGMGGDLVGMTAGSEAILMAEAGVKYGCLGVVTNLAAGLSDGKIAHGDVNALMKSVSQPLLSILEAAIARL